jgi:hypothetical protein
VPVGQGLKQRGGGAVPKKGGVETGRAPGGGRTGRTGAIKHLLCQFAGGCRGVGCCCSKRVRTLVDSGWNVHLGREMAVCLIVIPGGEGCCVSLSMCKSQRERAG